MRGFWREGDGLGLEVGADRLPVGVSSFAIFSGVPTAIKLAAELAPFGAQIDDPVGGLDQVHVVLDDEHRVALFRPAFAARRSVF